MLAVLSKVLSSNSDLPFSVRTLKDIDTETEVSNIADLALKLISFTESGEWSLGDFFRVHFPHTSRLLYVNL